MNICLHLVLNIIILILIEKKNFAPTEEKMKQLHRSEEKLLSQLLELNENEKIFKEMYLNHPELLLDQPRKLDELTKITARLQEKKELAKLSHLPPDSSAFPDKFFSDKWDVLSNRHDRYSPCFLHEHDFFEIAYVVQGSCTNYMPEQTLHMKTGDFCLMPLHTPHAISVFDDSTIVINIMLRAHTFKQAFFGLLSQKDVISSFFSRALYTQNTDSYLLFRTGSDQTISELVLKIYHEVTNNRNYSDRMRNVLVTELFILLLRHHQQNLSVSNPVGHDMDHNIMFIMNYMMNNYNTLSLKSLSSFFGYSERQMTRILKDYTGKSFTIIIQDIRIQQACELLRNTEIPVGEVAETIGYSNLSHFYSIFKKVHGVTPAQYRTMNA